jgi:hypothetical protein
VSDYLGCVRVDPPGPVVSGSVQRDCVDCGTKVWVAPSGVKLIATGIRPVCLSCLKGRVERDPDPHFMAPSAEQLRELGGGKT